MRYEYLPLSELINKLHSICLSGHTGIMFVISDTNLIQIHINKGKVINATLGAIHGWEALRILKNLKKVRFSFSEGLVIPQHDGSFFDQYDINNNDDVFSKIGINLSNLKDIRKTILIIDDSKISRKAAKEVLLKHQYKVLEAVDGINGIEILAKQTPDLVLLDIVMPRMNGFKVLSLIKEANKYKNLPVIMLTSRDSLLDKIKGKVSNANEYIIKPFVAKDLIAKIDFHLNEKKENIETESIRIKNKNTTNNENKKVLIIDDSKIARRFAREALLEHNYEVIESPDGMHGIACLAKEKPDLILLDIVMPEMDGYKVLSLIKGTGQYDDLPIIMLTSRNKLLDKLKGKLSNANEYITKPFATEELISKVDFYLKK
jgi:DNA-binding response OmpR family regulator